MSWLTPIDRKEHPLGWWARLDGALGRIVGWRIVVTLAIADYYLTFGQWFLLAGLAFVVIMTAVTEFRSTGSAPKSSPAPPVSPHQPDPA